MFRCILMPWRTFHRGPQPTVARVPMLRVVSPLQDDSPSEAKAFAESGFLECLLGAHQSSGSLPCGFYSEGLAVLGE